MTPVSDSWTVVTALGTIRLVGRRTTTVAAKLPRKMLRETFLYDLQTPPDSTKLLQRFESLMALAS